MKNVLYSDEKIMMGNSLCYLRTKHVRNSRKMIYSIRSHKNGKGVKYGSVWCYEGGEAEALLRLQKKVNKRIQFVLYVPLQKVKDYLVDVPPRPVYQDKVANQ